MAEQPEFSRPVEVYKAIIDDLVEYSRDKYLRQRIVESSIYSKAPAHCRFNEFIATLSAEQRELLAEMLNDKRGGAVHDVLSRLTWWILCQDVALTFKGEAMPVELSGMGLHGDFVGRRDGWEWPDDEDSTKNQQGDPAPRA